MSRFFSWPVLGLAAITIVTVFVLAQQSRDAMQVDANNGALYPGQAQYPGGASAPNQGAYSQDGGEQRRGGPTGPFYRLRWAPIMDQYGFGQPVEAMRVLVPADWRVEGGVQWGPPTGCHQNLVKAALRASSADGASGLELFTPYVWQWHDDPLNRQTVIEQSRYLQPAIRPCEMRPVMRAVDVIQQMVIPQYRSGARVVSTEPLPQLAQARTQAMQAEYAAYIQAGAVSGVQADAGKVAITYEVNGRPVEEWITGVVETAAQRAPSASGAYQGAITYVNSYTVRATALIAARAPAGELQAKSRMYAAMVGSLRANPPWVGAVGTVIGSIIKGEQMEVGKRIAIFRELSQQTGDIITRAYAAQQETQARVANAYSESVRGVETYYDPHTRESVQLTGGYRQAWSNGRGEYILSDDPNFDPSVALRENWTAMQRPR